MRRLDATPIDRIRQRLRESIEVKERLLRSEETLGAIGDVATALCDAYRRGAKMLIFGNGGSAADAQHIAAELVGGFTIKQRPALAVDALTVNTSSLTAIGNDYDFSDVFARQIEAFGRAGDVAVGLSTSGTSVNVVRALEMARKNGLVTVALTGQSGGRVMDVADHCVRVPSSDVARIQEAHIVIGHVLCELVESHVFGRHEEGH
jgi:D-sedoheptulose 7-phosphate isomerase